MQRICIVDSGSTDSSFHADFDGDFCTSDTYAWAGEGFVADLARRDLHAAFEGAIVAEGSVQTVSESVLLSDVGVTSEVAVSWLRPLGPSS